MIMQLASNMRTAFTVRLPDSQFLAAETSAGPSQAVLMDLQSP